MVTRQIEKAQNRVEKINMFMLKTLASSDPNQGGREDATIVSAMATAISELRDGLFKDDPEKFIQERKQKQSKKR